MGNLTPSNPYKNIILVGPGGSLGSVLLKGLLAEPAFNVSVLVRESSKSNASLDQHANLNIVKIADDYPYENIVQACRGQNVVVDAITSTEVHEQFKFIDAAIETGVKRYVPSEYGLNNLRPEARALNAVFDTKGKVQEYLKAKEATGLTWNAIGCGMWIDWPCGSLKNSFLGLDHANRTISLADSGSGKFNTSTMSNVALALNRCLLNPGLTENQVVYISDFATSQAELVAAFERFGGEEWTKLRYDSAKAIDEYQAKYAAGDGAAAVRLIELGFVTGKYGGWFEREKLWNGILDLPCAELDEVVRQALTSA